MYVYNVSFAILTGSSLNGEQGSSGSSSSSSSNSSSSSSSFSSDSSSSGSSDSYSSGSSGRRRLLDVASTKRVPRKSSRRPSPKLLSVDEHAAHDEAEEAAQKAPHGISKLHIWRIYVCV